MIVRRGLEIADAEGLDAVSFRRLAEEFGVTPMALYRHVRDKADLLDGMVDLVLADVHASKRRDAGWTAELRALVRSASRALDTHPAGAALMLSGPATAPNAQRLTASVLDILGRAGFAPGEAMAIVQQMTTVVVGPRILYGGSGSWRGAAVGREFGVELLLAGLESMLARKKPKL